MTRRWIAPGISTMLEGICDTRKGKQTLSLVSELQILKQICYMGNTCHCNDVIDKLPLIAYLEGMRYDSGNAANGSF